MHKVTAKSDGLKLHNDMMHICRLFNVNTTHISSTNLQCFQHATKLYQ